MMVAHSSLDLLLFLLALIVSAALVRLVWKRTMFSFRRYERRGSDGTSETYTEVSYRTEEFREEFAAQIPKALVPFKEEMAETLGDGLSDPERDASLWLQKNFHELAWVRLRGMLRLELPRRGRVHNARSSLTGHATMRVDATFYAATATAFAAALPATFLTGNDDGTQAVLQRYRAKQRAHFAAQVAADQVSGNPLLLFLEPAPDVPGQGEGSERASD